MTDYVDCPTCGQGVPGERLAGLAAEDLPITRIAYGPDGEVVAYLRLASHMPRGVLDWFDNIDADGVSAVTGRTPPVEAE